MFISLGIAAALVCGVCFLYGYKEYVVSKKWKSEKLKKLEDGVQVKELKSKGGMFTRYFKYLYLPLLSYCLVIYILYTLSASSDFVATVLRGYFDLNQSFVDVCTRLFGTIDRHYIAVLENAPIRARTLVHMYSVLFTGMILQVLCFLPSLPAWVRQIYYFELVGYGLIRSLFSLIFFTVIYIAICSLFFEFSMNVSANHISGRWGFDLDHNDDFLYVISVYFAVLGLSGLLLSASISGYISAFYGDPKINRTKTSDK